MFCFDVKFKWSCCFQDLTKSLQSTLELKSKTKQEGAEDTVMCWDGLPFNCIVFSTVYHLYLGTLPPTRSQSVWWDYSAQWGKVDDRAGKEILLTRSFVVMVACLNEKLTRHCSICFMTFFCSFSLSNSALILAWLTYDIDLVIGVTGLVFNLNWSKWSHISCPTIKSALPAPAFFLLPGYAALKSPGR